jgi:hypothetical protein
VASGVDAPFVKSLGADRVIDYRVSRFEQCVCDIDVVFDTVGAETLERSWSVLKPQGRMIAIPTTNRFHGKSFDQISADHMSVFPPIAHDNRPLQISKQIDVTSVQEFPRFRRRKRRLSINSFFTMAISLERRHSKRAAAFRDQGVRHFHLAEAFPYPPPYDREAPTGLLLLLGLALFELFSSLWPRRLA